MKSGKTGRLIKNRILLFADGCSIHTERWIEGLQQEGRTDIHVISMNPAGYSTTVMRLLPESNLHVIAPATVRQSGNNWGYLTKLLSVRRTVRQINPQTIIAFYLTSYGLLAALGKKGHTTLVQYLMGSDVMVTPARGYLFKIISRFAAGKADLIICSSHTMNITLRTFFEPTEEKLLIQQYGVADWILALPERQKEYTCISNRAWIDNSNIPLVIELFSKFPHHARLALAGTKTLSPALEAQYAKHHPGIHLVPHLPYSEMIDMVSKSEFFFSLTNSDGASLSLMEAMALGCIPIASDIAPNREWIKDGENGFLINLRDKTSSHNQIRRILELSSESKVAMIKMNKAIILARGCRSKNMQRLLGKLDSLHSHSSN